MDGQKIISAKYDFASPFSNEISKYSIGGEEIYENGKTKKQTIQKIGYEGIGDRHYKNGQIIKK